MYDAIVVGARCAGAPTAMLLGRKRYRVLLVDRARFPSDTISTHYLTPDGVARLDAWGLLERVRASGCPDLPGVSFTIDGQTLSPPRDPSTAYPGLCPRRTVLDKILVDAAAEAGVEVRQGFSMRELTRDGERVTGLKGQGGQGAVEESARITIGADGKESPLARQVGAEEYNVRPAITCGYYSYYSGIQPRSAAELYITDRKAMFLFPTNDDLTCVATEWPAEHFEELRSDVEGGLLRAFSLVPGLAERVKAGKREERWLGMRIPQSFYRKPYGPGWALVGDAGFHKDPVLGQGITDAFRDSELLADAIDAGLSGKQPMDQALAAYQQQRDAATAILYEVTNQFATLAPSKPLLEMMAAQAAAAAG